MINCHRAVGRKKGAQKAKNEHLSTFKLLAFTISTASLNHVPSFQLSAASLKLLPLGEQIDFYNLIIRVCKLPSIGSQWLAIGNRVVRLIWKALCFLHFPCLSFLLKEPQMHKEKYCPAMSCQRQKNANNIVGHTSPGSPDTRLTHVSLFLFAHAASYSISTPIAPNLQGPAQIPLPLFIIPLISSWGPHPYDLIQY